MACFWRAPDALALDLNTRQGLLGEARLTELAHRYLALLDAGLTHPDRLLPDLPSRPVA